MEAKKINAVLKEWEKSVSSKQYVNLCNNLNTEIVGFIKVISLISRKRGILAHEHTSNLIAHTHTCTHTHTELRHGSDNTSAAGFRVLPPGSAVRQPGCCDTGPG